MECQTQRLATIYSSLDDRRGKDNTSIYIEQKNAKFQLPGARKIVTATEASSLVTTTEILLSSTSKESIFQIRDAILSRLSVYKKRINHKCLVKEDTLNYRREEQGGYSAKKLKGQQNLPKKAEGSKLTTSSSLDDSGSGKGKGGEGEEGIVILGDDTMCNHLHTSLMNIYYGIEILEKKYSALLGERKKGESPQDCDKGSDDNDFLSTVETSIAECSVALSHLHSSLRECCELIAFKIK